jgi:hypothetical protein
MTRFRSKINLRSQIHPLKKTKLRSIKGKLAFGVVSGVLLGFGNSI